MSLVAAVIAGLAAGFISGMGIGGGAILIPCLCMLGFSQQTAQGVNLIYFIPTAAIAVFTHIKNKNIKKDLVLPMILFGLPFAALGAVLALNIGKETLGRIFGFFLVAVGAYEIIRKEKNNEKHKVR